MLFNLGRILTSLATLAAVLLGAALGVPALMNWDHLRAPVETRARTLLGAPVRVDGRITVQFLPWPQVSLSDVIIEPTPGAPLSGNFARARVHLSLWPLLSGKAVPVALSLSGADLDVDREALADGTTAGMLRLPLTVQGGKAHLEADAAAEITGLSFSARPGEDGDTRIRFSAVFAGTPFSVQAVLGSGGTARLHSATLNFGEGEAVLSVVRAASPAGVVDLTVKLKPGEKGAAFLARLLPPLGQVARPEQLGRLGPLFLALRAVPEEGAFALQDLEITAGPLRLTGRGRFRPGTRAVLDLELGAQTMVLGGSERGFDPSGLLRVLGHIAEWGGRLDGGIRLHADHVLAGGAILREGEIHITFGAEGARLDRFHVSLPHGLTLSGRGLVAAPGQLAALVHLDGAHTSNLPGLPETGRFGGNEPLTMEGRLLLSGARAQFRDVRIAAGRNAVRAEGALFFGERMAAELRVEAGDLDLRPWGLTWDRLTPDVSVDSLWNAVQALAGQADITFQAEVGSLRLTDSEWRGGVLDLALDRGQAALRRLSLKEADGRTIEARLRAPLAVPEAAGEGAKQDSDWITRAEAAIDVRPGQGNGGGIAWRAGLWDGTLSFETSGPVSSRLSGRLSRSDEAFRWSELSGRIGKASVHGQFSLSRGVRPVLRGTLSTDSAAIRLAGGADGELWPTRKLADFWPRFMDIHLDWSADALEFAGAALEKASGTAVLDEDSARLTLVSGALYGGAASGAAALNSGPDGTMTWEAQGVVQQADLAAIMGGAWRGRGLLRLSASGSGTNIAEFVNGMRGTVGLDFNDGRIGGIDVNALEASLKAADSAAAMRAAVERAFGGGATPFRRLEGEAKIGNGEMVLSGISAQAETGPIMLSGVVNLPARLIAAQADISLGDGVTAPLSVQFIGRLEAPDRVVDTERFAGRVVR